MQTMHPIDAFSKLQELDGLKDIPSTPSYRIEHYKLVMELVLCLGEGSRASFALVEKEDSRRLPTRDWGSSTTISRFSRRDTFIFIEFTWLLESEYSKVTKEGFKLHSDESVEGLGKRGILIKEFHAPKPAEIARLLDRLCVSVVNDESYGIVIFNVLAVQARITAEYLVRAMQSNRLVKCKVCSKEIAELASVCPNCGVNLPGLHLQCANCGSIYVTIEKKGFGVGKATVGGALFGAVGLVAGMIGSKDNEFVCLACGNRWSL